MGRCGRAAVPSGASTGAHEAVELRDGGKKRYGGKGVTKAVDAANGEIFDALCGMDAEDQLRLDELMCELDGTPNKSRLGANAILGVSLAIAKASAAAARVPLYRYVGGPAARTLPVPQMNIVNGGVHADNPIDFQEFMIVPAGRADLCRGAAHGRRNLSHAEGRAARRRPQHQRGRRGRLRAQPEIRGRGARLYRARHRKGRLQARRGRVPGARSRFKEFFKDGRYVLAGEGKTPRPRRHGQGLCRTVRAAIPSSPSKTAWRKTIGTAGRRSPETLGAKIQLVGDDLFVTNIARLKEGIDRGVANAILIKVNQIGTLSETLATVDMANRAAYRSVMSHRSGETEDSTIADLAVATNCGQIKTGSLARSDRLAKYNQLLRIEEELGDQAIYAGRSILRTARG